MKNSRSLLTPLLFRRPACDLSLDAAWVSRYLRAVRYSQGLSSWTRKSWATSEFGERLSPLLAELTRAVTEAARERDVHTVLHHDAEGFGELREDRRATGVALIGCAPCVHGDQSDGAILGLDRRTVGERPT